MHVLVTGASGFLGSHIVEQLIASGHTARCLVRKSSNTKFLNTLSGVELAYGDINDEKALNEAVKGVTAIVHAAGLVKAKGPAEFHAVNVEGTRDVLNAALEHRSSIRRFTFISSLASQRPSIDGNPIPDDATPEPVTHYGRSKLRAEQLVLSHKDDIPITVIRPPMIYGPRDRESLILFQMVAKGIMPILGTGKQTLSCVFGPDCAAACRLAIDIDHASGSTYYVDDGKTYTHEDIGMAIAAALGKTAPLRIRVPTELLRVYARFSATYGKIFDKAMFVTPDKVAELAAPNWVCSSEKIRRELGYMPQFTWPEGAKITVNAYRAEGLL